jgi:hypothetical protein
VCSSTQQTDPSYKPGMIFPHQQHPCMHDKLRQFSILGLMRLVRHCCVPTTMFLTSWHGGVTEQHSNRTKLLLEPRAPTPVNCTPIYHPSCVCPPAGWLNILYALLFGMLFSRTCAVIFWTLLATLLLPAKPLLCNAVLRSPVFATWRRYFNFSYLQETAIDPSKRYILVQYPHAVFPLSQLVGGTARACLCPEWSIYTLAADSVFYVPVWKQFVSWLGAVPANSKSFKNALSKGSVSVIVGGIAGGLRSGVGWQQYKANSCAVLLRCSTAALLYSGLISFHSLISTDFSRRTCTKCILLAVLAILTHCLWLSLTFMQRCTCSIRQRSASS